EVHLWALMNCSTPQKAAKRSSKAATCGPRTNCVLSITPATAASTSDFICRYCAFKSRNGINDLLLDGRAKILRQTWIAEFNVLEDVWEELPAHIRRSHILLTPTRSTHEVTRQDHLK